MSDKPPIDVVAEPSQAVVVVREQGGAVGILRPADSLDRIAEAFKEYQRVCETILDASDYQEYEGKKRKKKSAWRKLATAFNVSTSIVREEIKEGERGHVLSASFTVKAFCGPEANPYRQFQAVGSCSVFEKCCPTAEGQKCRKAAWKGHYCCPNGCDGRKHWTHPDHDVKSTAQTRATNRAIADLIGCGEVSAEELGDDSPTLPQGQAPGTEQGESWEKASEAKKPQANAPTPEKPVSAPTNGNVKCATLQQKAKLLEALSPQKELAERFMRAIDWLFPTEPIEKLELAYVPVTKKQFDLLMERLEACKNGEPAVAPYPPNPTPDPPTKPKAENVPETETEGVKINPAWEVCEGQIVQVSLKEGKKKDGTAWSLWGIKIGEDWHNTFSNRIGQAAQAAKHDRRAVKLYFSKDNEGRREAQEIV